MLSKSIFAVVTASLLCTTIAQKIWHMDGSYYPASDDTAQQEEETNDEIYNPYGGQATTEQPSTTKQSDPDSQTYHINPFSYYMLHTSWLQTKLPKQRNPLRGRITKQMCFQKSYRHLKSCFLAITNPSLLEQYSNIFLCKEREKARKMRLNPDAEMQSRTVTQYSTVYNPCSGTAVPQETEHLEALDLNGNVVELFFDLNQKIFPTFFVKECTQRHFNGMPCQEVEMIVETGIYLPNSYNVVLREVRISIDCALHVIF